MIHISVRFEFRGKHWTRDVSTAQGVSVQRLKETLLNQEGSNEDLDAFELRRPGRRYKNHELLWQSECLDFKYIGVGRGKTRAEKERRANAAPLKSSGEAIDLDGTLRFQRDLIAGYSSEEFQRKLRELKQELEGNPRKFPVERQKLFLTVQSQVLPKYGFAGTPRGVFDMMRVFGMPRFQEFERCEEFRANSKSIPWLLGLDTPPEPLPAPPQTEASVFVKFPWAEAPVPIQFQPGGNILRIKEQICKGDPTGQARPDGFNLVDEKEPTKHLSDSHAVYAGMMLGFIG